jgi:serine/threonine protein phosphatase PrpC
LTKRNGKRSSYVRAVRAGADIDEGRVGHGLAQQDGAMMRDEGELVVVAGFASAQGPRADNQDFGACCPAAQPGQAVLAAVADGVSGGRAGRVAAELAVRSAFDGFHAMPATLGPVRALHAPIAAFNRWLHAQGRGDTMRGSATTLTVLALQGRQGHVLHIGDSRAWRFAGGRLACLTTDHVRPEPDLDHVLVRALGLDGEVRLDHAAIELAERDRLILTTDGVHGVLSPRRIAAILALPASAEASAQDLVDAALAAGGQDNATALVIDVVRLPLPDHAGIFAGLAALPVVVPPGPGDSIDGFAVERVLSSGRYAVLVVARDGDRGERVVLKFPRPGAASERTMRLACAREVLIGQRLRSPFVVETLPVAPDRRSALYGVQPLLTGETMAARLDRGVPGLGLALMQAVRLTRAVVALHRLDIIHRDIKPDNVMLTDDGGLKLIDLGIARLPSVEDIAGDDIPGTPGFMAPEQFDGHGGDALTDQFALGVTLYRWFTGAMPFGEQEAFQRPRFGPPPPMARHRPDMPSWLDEAICTAIQPDRTRRYGDVIELLRVLESAGPIHVPVRRRAPLIERYPVQFWQAIAALLAIALIASLVLRR